MTAYKPLRPREISFWPSARTGVIQLYEYGQPHRSRDMPDIVRPWRFAPESEDQPIQRRQTAREMANWMATMHCCLAPATPEYREQIPDARWMMWRTGRSYRRTSANSFTVTTDLDVLHDMYLYVLRRQLIGHRFDASLNAVLSALSAGGLDDMRSWFLDPNRRGDQVPEFWLRDEPASLVDCMANLPEGTTWLTPRQWRIAARSWREDRLPDFGPYLLERGVRLVDAEARRRLHRLPPASGRARARRL